MIAKLCSTAFKKTSRRILEDARGNFAVPPGTQPEAMESEDLRVGMKRAAEDIARSKFVIYNFSPVFQWGLALSDTAAAAVRTGASVAAAPVCTSAPAALQRPAFASAEGRSWTPCRCSTCAPACWK